MPAPQQHSPTKEFTSRLASIPESSATSMGASFGADMMSQQDIKCATKCSGVVVLKGWSDVGGAPLIIRESWHLSEVSVCLKGSKGSSECLG